MPLMYDELADWWPLLSPPDEYAEEAAQYLVAMTRASRRPVRSVLELGSGGGNNASHLKQHVGMTLVEPAPGMLEVSRRLNPECEHVQGDMRHARLGRDFDAVFVHDAVCYMTTRDDLRRAMETAYVHCRPGGVALFAPDCTRETFAPSTDHGGTDGDGRALRFLEWTWDPDPADETFIADYTLVLREGMDVRVRQDRHLEGLFPRSAWLGLLASAGFEPGTASFTHSGVDRPLEVFIGRR